MRLIPALLCLCIVSACDKTYILGQPTTDPSNIGTNPNQPVPQSIKVEYRVSGNPINARIRFSNPFDGLVQVITALPYSVSFTATTDSLFVSLEATPLSYPFTVIHPFMSVQIFVNGMLFREASSADFVLNPISVNGTWRR